MKTQHRELIESIRRSVNPDRNLIEQAQQAILHEVRRIPFSSLLYVWADVRRKRIQLEVTPTASMIQQVAEETFSDMEREASDIFATGEREALISEISSPLQVFEAIRFVTPYMVLLQVSNLDSAWLSNKAEGPYDDVVTNGDLVHIAIAHEAIGDMFGLDPVAPETMHELDKSKFAVKERSAHICGAYQFIHHIIRDRKMHQTPEIYSAKGKPSVLEALVRGVEALKELGNRPVDGTDDAVIEELRTMIIQATAKPAE